MPIHWYENETNQIYWSEGIECKSESNVETLDEVAITAKRIERNNMGIGHKENVSYDPESDDGRFDCYLPDSYGRRSLYRGS